VTAAAFLAWSVLVAQLLLASAMCCAALRMLLGPRAQDRVLALDTLYVDATMLLLTIGIRTGSSLYFEAALVIALLGFVATAALAKFIMRGEVIE
jgi:multicomponent K+:H+ antiporter subunit F